MANTRYYVLIKNEKVPVQVRNYQNSNSVKLYFKADTLCISKPAALNFSRVESIIKENENSLYDEYMKIISTTNLESSIKHWVTGEKMLYLGEDYTVKREHCDLQTIGIKIDVEKKQIVITLPNNLLDEKVIKENVDRGIKSILKNNTYVKLQERLPEISSKMGIKYSYFKVHDATTKLGSCIPQKKSLNFNLRLVMLPQRAFDAIIIHELAHIKYPNHSKEFYEYIKKYEPDYDNIDKWLKENAKRISI